MQRSNNARATGVQIRFLSARAHGDSVSCSRSGEGDGIDSSACSHLGIVYFSDIFISFVTAVYLYFGYIHRLSLYLYLYSLLPLRISSSCFLTA